MNRYIIGTLSLLLLVACSSCKVYQYNVLTSDTRGEGSEPFTFENDTIRISYFFNSGNGQIEIYNKLSTPLYVDWSRSALVANGIAEPYWSGTGRVDLTITDSAPISFGTKTGSATGTINSGSPVAFLPPESKVIHTPFSLLNKTQIVKYPDKPKIQKYSEDTSPLKFRSYIQLSLTSDFSTPIQLNHKFWIAETRLSNQKIPMMPKQNIYMVSETTGAGYAGYGLVFFGVLVGAVVMATDMPTLGGQ